MKNFFGFSKYQTDYKNEIIAALSTFGTMAYVLVINATILHDTGMDFGAVMVATIIVTALSCLLMGVIAHYPIALAPGMGVSAYITYTLVLTQGKSWEECLAASFIVALLLLTLTACKVRQKLLTEIPVVLRQAIPAGIGLFLIFIGLKNAGVITQKHEGLIAFGHLMTSDVLFTFLAVSGIFLLEFFKIRSAFILIILISWILSTALGYIPFKGFVAPPPSLKPTLFKLNFSTVLSWDFFTVFFSIFLVTLLDSTAALTTLVKQAKRLNEKGQISHIRKALIPDAIGTFVGSLIGSAAIVVHMESAAGIKAGGKTGFVPFFVALCFLSCIFFYPIVVTIPPFAPSAVLIVLGFSMAIEVKAIDWKEWSDYLPALVVFITMPITLSIYNGFSFGFIAYSVCKILRGKVKEIHPLIAILSCLFLGHRLLEYINR